MVDWHDQARPDVPPTPREIPEWFFVRRMQSMIFVGCLCAGLGVVFGVGLPVLFYFLGGRVTPMADMRLDQAHEVATATVTGTEMIESIHVGSKHPLKISYVFETKDGEQSRGSGYSYKLRVEEVAVGGQIEVEYDPIEPRVSRPAGGTMAAIPPGTYLIMLALVLPECLIGLYCLARVFRNSRRERLLLSLGEAVQGEVVAVRCYRLVHFGRNSPYDIYYGFRDRLGRLIEGKDRTYHYDWARSLTPGDSIEVIYNPEFPRENALWLHGKDRNQ